MSLSQEEHLKPKPSPSQLLIGILFFSFMAVQASAQGPAGGTPCLHDDPDAIYKRDDGGVDHKIVRVASVDKGLEGVEISLIVETDYQCTPNWGWKIFSKTRSSYLLEAHHKGPFPGGGGLVEPPEFIYTASSLALEYFDPTRDKPVLVFSLDVRQSVAPLPDGQNFVDQSYTYHEEVNALNGAASMTDAQKTMDFYQLAGHDEPVRFKNSEFDKTSTKQFLTVDGALDHTISEHYGRKTFVIHVPDLLPGDDKFSVFNSSLSETDSLGNVVYSFDDSLFAALTGFNRDWEFDFRRTSRDEAIQKLNKFRPQEMPAPRIDDDFVWNQPPF